MLSLPAPLAPDDTGSDAEWLETNGLGDFAAGTVGGTATRRYHGLLVARPPGNPKRHLWVSRFDERVVLGGAPAEVELASFELRPWPRTTWLLEDGTRLIREILLAHGRRLALLRYSVTDASAALELRLRPLVPAREADALTIENDVLDERAKLVDGGFSVHPYPGLPAIAFGFGRSTWVFTAEPLWQRGLRFALDEARGYQGSEDQWSPGSIRAQLDPQTPLHIAIGLDGVIQDPRTLFEQEIERRTHVRLDGVVARSELAADDFLAETPEGRLGITAGFPWFDEWGRDTFIALPGLTLARGRDDLCARALLGALPFLRAGLLPNIYGLGPADSHYGSADAALWFARGCLLYDRNTSGRNTSAPAGRATLGELRPALESIVESYLAGTELGLAVDERGLLHAGSPALNPTWMDARVDGVPVTPRAGAPVELNALWYSLVAHVEQLAMVDGDKPAASRWRSERRRAARAFLDAFWLADELYLADLWQDGIADRTVRPNMVLAAALELSPLTRAHRRGVCARARAELLTPRGLRTLSPRDARYVGTYAGGPNERDAAYHQGTAWPWLLGFYVEARLRAAGAKPKRSEVRELTALWEDFAPELERGGLGHISEVFSGDPPHAPGGTFAQAWNTAELLRSLALLRPDEVLR